VISFVLYLWIIAPILKIVDLSIKKKKVQEFYE
jgi:hypothetical protein